MTPWKSKDWLGIEPELLSESQPRYALSCNPRLHDAFVSLTHSEPSGPNQTAHSPTQQHMCHSNAPLLCQWWGALRSTSSAQWQELSTAPSTAESLEPRKSTTWGCKMWHQRINPRGSIKTRIKPSARPSMQLGPHKGQSRRVQASDQGSITTESGENTMLEAEFVSPWPPEQTDNVAGLHSCSGNVLKPGSTTCPSWGLVPISPETLPMSLMLGWAWWQLISACLRNSKDNTTVTEAKNWK